MATAPNPRDLVVLGIETSCDETAAAWCRREASGKGVILANVVRSQLALHAEFGGVVPEIAARAHVELLDVLIAEALTEARLGFDDDRRRRRHGGTWADRRADRRRHHG